MEIVKREGWEVARDVARRVWREWGGESEE
jgi:hypothetical protein